jgi:hypothetical protein
MPFRHTLILSILLAIGAAPAALTAQDPPIVRYGPTRESKAWIDTTQGRMAVDEGAEWQGVKVYLSLTWDLVAVDSATSKTLWCHSVGAFWNELTFKELGGAEGSSKRWAVELRPGARATEGRELRQYHDLTRGALIAGAGSEPAGKRVLPLTAWTGGDVADPAPLRTLIAEERDWQDAVLKRYFAPPVKAPAFGTIDFVNNVALVIMDGDAFNCRGMDAEVWEDDTRILVRLRRRSFQTMSRGEGSNGGARKHRPFGIFLLPRRDPWKLVIVENNVQGLIGGPPIWKESARFTRLPHLADGSGK